MTNQYIEGTQRAALESISQRFTVMVGDLAVAERVVDAGMNVGAVADALAAAVLAKYGLEDWDFDDDEDMPEGWEEIGDESETPALDVTAHLKRMLSRRKS